MCSFGDEPFMILEHDTKFLVDPKPIVDYVNDHRDKALIVGLNDPRGATRKASVFHNSSAIDSYSRTVSSTTSVFNSDSFLMYSIGVCFGDSIIHLHGQV